MSKKINGVVFLILIVTVLTTAWLKYGRSYVYGIKTNRAQVIADELFLKASIFKKTNGYNPKIADVYFTDIEYFDTYDDKIINHKCYGSAGWGCKSINLRADEVGNFEVLYTYDLYDCSKKETESEWYCFWND